MLAPPSVERQMLWFWKKMVLGSVGWTMMIRSYQFCG
jgi:hypothetical protein